MADTVKSKCSKGFSDTIKCEIHMDDRINPKLISYSDRRRKYSIWVYSNEFCPASGCKFCTNRTDTQICIGRMRIRCPLCKMLSNYIHVGALPNVELYQAECEKCKHVLTVCAGCITTTSCSLLHCEHVKNIPPTVTKFWSKHYDMEPITDDKKIVGYKFIYDTFFLIYDRTLAVPPDELKKYSQLKPDIKFRSHCS